MTVETPAETLRRAAEIVEQTHADMPDEHHDTWRKPLIRAALVPWVALMDPAVAPALAAWLRQAAGQAEIAAEFIPAVITDSGVLDTSFVVEHALTFARILLGEQP